MIAQLEPFHAIAVSTLAHRLGAEGRSVIHMEFGQPSTGAPAAAIAVAHRVLDTEAMGYWESPELKARIASTRAFLSTVNPSQLDGTEQKDVTFPSGRDSTRTMKGEAYLKHWMLPNFFFHVTTAYALLRHNGVDLGKADYLAGAGLPE